jgi:lipoprotein-releasing system permease protein
VNSLQFSIAIRYIVRRRRQTLICMAGVAIGVAIFVAMNAMMKGFETKFIDETVEGSGHASVKSEPRETVAPFLEKVYGPDAVIDLVRQKPQDKVAKIRNPEKVMRMIRSLPGVVAAAPTVSGNAVLAYGSKQMAVEVDGIEPVEQVRVTSIGSKLVEGSEKGFERLRSTANGILLGDGLARLLGAKLGDTLIATGPAGARTSTRVVGIFSTGITAVDQSRAYMLLRDAQELLDKQNVITEITVKGDDPEKARALAAQIEEITGQKTESWQEANQNFLSIFVVQQAITMIIAGAILLVAAFGVFNILTMSVMEKVNDIAIMRSYGLTRTDIRNSFIIQGALIGVVGAVAGMGIAKLVVIAIRQLKFPVEGIVKAQGILMAERPGDYATAAVAALVITLVSAALPANRAARFNPVDILRGRH